MSLISITPALWFRKDFWAGVQLHLTLCPTSYNRYILHSHTIEAILVFFVEVEWYHRISLQSPLPSLVTLANKVLVHIASVRQPQVLCFQNGGILPRV
ncbi:hypothetical protein SCLCIDRAFT_189564 [Scleroderma citrinum Foug A]|uniref:Uncharacterized protein n=1 Tax=Scleroderma citrinum Foug A TaxID=1036808 RepID=A0A0C3D8K5_9AGAM|nr:hypothetical protein SCLCIDRAFT_189564 [Scleroderma citrinum Foug A]